MSRNSSCSTPKKNKARCGNGDKCVTISRRGRSSHHGEIGFTGRPGTKSLS